MWLRRNALSPKIPTRIAENSQLLGPPTHFDGSVKFSSVSHIGFFAPKIRAALFPPMVTVVEHAAVARIGPKSFLISSRFSKRRRPKDLRRPPWRNPRRFGHSAEEQSKKSTRVVNFFGGGCTYIIYIYIDYRYRFVFARWDCGKWEFFIEINGIYSSQEALCLVTLVEIDRSWGFKQTPPFRRTNLSSSLGGSSLGGSCQTIPIGKMEN